MAKHKLLLPRMGEGIIEATINKWLKDIGDYVNEDEAIVEVATDKVDSEVPSPVDGKIVEFMFNEGDVAPVDEVIAVIETEGEEEENDDSEAVNPVEKPSEKQETKQEEKSEKITDTSSNTDLNKSDRYLSPLVKSIAKKEGITLEELNNIKGSGKDNRLVKNDLLSFLELRSKGNTTLAKTNTPTQSIQAPPVNANPGDEVYQMDRMRRLIADHMVMSSHVSPHVTSFIDVDVTNIVNWRGKVKDALLKREGEKITYTPVFINAVAQALKDYPQVNASLDGYNVILRKSINIGMAAALPNGNLIVPVIKDADQKNILGTAKIVNDLAKRSRENKLQPNEIQGGTFTITNFGSFDSLSGTPIINQPQVAILGVGAIRKRPVVVETPSGDMIAIRHIMILSMAYDHRIVDGAMGGMFLKRVKELLENFDLNTVI